MEFTGERYIPGLGNQIALEHLHRYTLALAYVVGKRVLDVACGEGYGSSMLATVAASVAGVDISSEAVNHAAAKYVQSNLEFFCAPAESLPLGSASVDVVVSFETIEHLEQQEAMLAELKRVLAPGGLLIISCPDRLNYSGVVGHDNPFHVKELYGEEFVALLQSYFLYVEVLGQRVVWGSLVAPAPTRSVSFATHVEGGESSLGLARPVYNLAFGTDGSLPELQGSLFELKPAPTDASLPPAREDPAGEQAGERPHSMVGFLENVLPKFDAQIESFDALREAVQGFHGAVDGPLLSLLQKIDQLQETLPEEFSAIKGLIEKAGRDIDTLCSGLEQQEQLTQSLLVSSERLTVAECQVQRRNARIVALSQQLRIVGADVVRLKAEVESGQGQLAQARAAGLESATCVEEQRRELASIAEEREVLAETVRRLERELEQGVHAFAELESSLAQERINAEFARNFADAASNNLHTLEDELRRVSQERDRSRQLLLMQGAHRLAELGGGRSKMLASLSSSLRRFSRGSWTIKRIAALFDQLAGNGAGWEKRLIEASGLFDAAYYLAAYPDVAQANMDPLQHYVTHGWREWRSPNPHFDPRGYLQSHPEVTTLHINPLLHHIYSGAALNALETEREVTENVSAVQFASVEEVYKAYEPCHLQDCYETEEFPQNLSLDVKALAFYLPQFHPTPENDRFWGKGFTEWTNVSKARPLYRGHCQPRLPGELGFYDTRVKEVLGRQIELAKQYGLYGFCLHHYYFSGAKVLRAPYNMLLANKDLDINFCLHWANESWTARFDGVSEKGSVLLEQQHYPESDISFMDDILPALRDDRYIRIDGRPLLLLYRPGLFPDIRATVERWREYAHKNKLGDPYLAAVQTSFEAALDPRDIGFDALVEFPPLRQGPLPPRINAQWELFDKDFQGNIYDYRAIMNDALELPAKEHPWFRGVMMEWDNTARRRDPHIFANGSPRLYQKWLEGAMGYARCHLPEQERFVFINAWNEWAEGTYLEPDRKYGYAYLNATARALAQRPETAFGPQTGSPCVLILSHDANMGGAQIVLLSLVRWLSRHTALSCKILCLADGPLLDEFAQVAPTTTLDQLCGKDATEDARLCAIEDFCGGKPALVYGNTVVAGRHYPLLSRLGAPIITHVHELEESIRVYASDCIAETLGYTQHFIACSPAVAQSLVEHRGVAPEKISTINAWIDPVPCLSGAKERSALRKRLGLPQDAVIVMGCGVGLFWRKGADIFVEIARRMRQETDVHFVWVGGFNADEEHEVYGSWGQVLRHIEKEGLIERLHLLGYQHNAKDYIAAADLFVLPSREDPFPLVCLEAADQGLPTVCFADAGGMPSFVEADGGIVVPGMDVEAMTNAVKRLCVDSPLRREMGDTARRKLHRYHTVDKAAPAILEIIRATGGIKPAVSVVVPNYNKMNFLRERLDSIFGQSFRDIEVILLDDASTDGSRDILGEYSTLPGTRLYFNDANQGVFAQWKRGVELAQSEIVWIAEADDACQLDLLAQLYPAFADNSVQMAYVQSLAIDENGNKLFDYGEMDYLLDISRAKWTTSYCCSGEDEVKSALFLRNTIPNMSAVLFRKFCLDDWFGIARDMKLAGDWVFYLIALQHGGIRFIYSPVNRHRRYSDTCTHGTACTQLRFDEVTFAQALACTMYALDDDCWARAKSLALGLWAELELPEEGFEAAYALAVEKAMHIVRSLSGKGGGT